MPGFAGWQEAGAGRAPRISSALGLADRLDAWKARWGIGRMSLLVPPGLYALGSPGPADEVAVTANYKVTFDQVREALAGRSLWLLVLETHGINVWCAAGKGAFGTEELVSRVQVTRLAEVVSHRRLLLPLLGAPGVAAHEVARDTGFRVHYAAAKILDLPAFLDGGRKTTPAMREVTFSFRERLALVPVEVSHSLKPMSAISAFLFAAGALLGGGSALAGALPVLALWGAMVMGTVATPLLLPWLPGRSFALKGAVPGALYGAAFRAWAWPGSGALVASAVILASTAVSAFFALNFTGSTPFTSRSGVKREMRVALPAIGTLLLASGLLWLAGRFA